MILVALLIFATVLMLSLGLLWLARSASLEYARAREGLLRPQGQTLAYPVPDGQDPALVMAALRRAGYRSVEVTSRVGRQVLVDCPSSRSRDRSHLRAVIGGVDGSKPRSGDVRFADEPDEVA